MPYICIVANIVEKRFRSFDSFFFPQQKGKFEGETTDKKVNLLYLTYAFPKLSKVFVWLLTGGHLEKKKGLLLQLNETFSHKIFVLKCPTKTLCIKKNQNKHNPSPKS